MKISLISIALGIKCMSRTATAYNSGEDRFSNRALATCPTSGILDASGKSCCPKSCGQCGGTGCHLRTGGAAACCTSQISTSCSTGKLPCILSGTTKPTSPPATSSCPTGSIADGTGKLCCPSSCGQCGGNGCHLRPGGSAACCTSQITKSCSSNPPPCKLAETGTGTSPPQTNKCPAGGILDSFGKVCCPGSCGTCGGTGCDKRNGGAANCCTSKVTTSCGAGKLPCVLGAGTPLPTPLPTVDVSGFCSDGILNVTHYGDCGYYTCCPKSCGECGDCSTPECCTYQIAKNIDYSDVDISCRTKGPPCIMPTIYDECLLDNPCMHGARCGVAWPREYTFRWCYMRTTCECDEVGNYAGQYCEITCGPKETPCGEKREPLGSQITDRHDKCCPSTDECIKIYSEPRIYPTSYIGYEYACFTKTRPTSCSPNPCLNGGECSNANIYDNDNLGGVYVCKCKSGFAGNFCELKV